MNDITKAERAELAGLVRHRESLARKAAEAAERFASWERQLSMLPSDDVAAVWRQLRAAAYAAVAEADERIAQRCREIFRQGELG